MECLLAAEEASFSKPWMVCCSAWFCSDILDSFTAYAFSTFFASSISASTPVLPGAGTTGLGWRLRFLEDLTSGGMVVFMSSSLGLSGLMSISRGSRGAWGIDLATGGAVLPPFAYEKWVQNDKFLPAKRFWLSFPEVNSN